MVIDVLNGVIRERGIPIAELARRAGIDGELLRRSLCGTRNLRATELIAICKELHLEVEDFLAVSN